MLNEIPVKYFNVHFRKTFLLDDFTSTTVPLQMMHTYLYNKQQLFVVYVVACIINVCIMCITGDCMYHEWLCMCISSRVTACTMFVLYLVS